MYKNRVKSSNAEFAAKAKQRFFECASSLPLKKGKRKKGSQEICRTRALINLLQKLKESLTASSRAKAPIPLKKLYCHCGFLCEGNFSFYSHPNN